MAISNQLPTFPHRVRGFNPSPQMWEGRVLPLRHRGPQWSLSMIIAIITHINVSSIFSVHGRCQTIRTKTEYTGKIIGYCVNDGETVTARDWQLTMKMIKVGSECIVDKKFLFFFAHFLWQHWNDGLVLNNIFISIVLLSCVRLIFLSGSCISYKDIYVEKWCQYNVCGISFCVRMLWFILICSWIEIMHILGKWNKMKV